MLACPAPQLYMYEETVVGNLEVKGGGAQKETINKQPRPLTTCLYYGRLAIQC